MASSRRRGSMPAIMAAVAVIATGLLWLSVPATATEPGLLKAASKDAYAMAAIIRGIRTHGSDVKVERQPTTVGGQVIQVFIRARPSAFARTGVYTLMLLTDRHGRVQLEACQRIRCLIRTITLALAGLKKTTSFRLTVHLTISGALGLLTSPIVVITHLIGLPDVSPVVQGNRS